MVRRTEVKLTTIVCPIDMSDFSKPVLAHATALGRWYGADVIALHVFAVVMPPATLGAYPAWMLQLPEGREAVAQELRSLLKPYTTEFRHILCATDFSSSSERGIELAVSLATRSNARLTILFT